ncbi:hypothetical protein CsatB_003420 [Cannabis sativa]|uniref:Glycosyltransferase family 92 protein n=1 Tax=Cannabis sativa TaxID=3483 RepID=A0A7J6HNN3_CANSA|nr:hypothetical protein F8388_005781 [Cannabis sativa]
MAGFSHNAIQSKDLCNWMMFVDVDEFIYSPSWFNFSKPSKSMLQFLLPTFSPSAKPNYIGQISIRCNEFGPSSQRSHPPEGVTQGYMCRRFVEQRHKSIVLLDAVNASLLNAIHHFKMKDRYKTVTMSLNRAVVNHFNYQAWSEFQNKFRRRVSTYVVDWKEKANLASNDRTPGLGFEAVEPKAWDQKFCEVKDERTNTNSVKSGGSGRIEASSAKEVTDEGKNDNENENESGSDEERGPNNAINTKSGGKNSSYSTQSGSTEDPRKG